MICLCGTVLPEEQSRGTQGCESGAMVLKLAPGEKVERQGPQNWRQH